MQKDDPAKAIEAASPVLREFQTKYDNGAGIFEAQGDGRIAKSEVHRAVGNNLRRWVEDFEKLTPDDQISAAEMLHGGGTLRDFLEAIDERAARIFLHDTFSLTWSDGRLRGSEVLAPRAVTFRNLWERASSLQRYIGFLALDAEGRQMLSGEKPVDFTSLAITAQNALSARDELLGKAALTPDDVRTISLDPNLRSAFVDRTVMIQGPCKVLSSDHITISEILPPTGRGGVPSRSIPHPGVRTKYELRGNAYTVRVKIDRLGENLEAMGDAGMRALSCQMGFTWELLPLLESKEYNFSH